MYYSVLLCTTEYKFVLQSTTKYYKVLLCTTEYKFVTTEENFVLQCTTVYYRLEICTTEYYKVLQSTTEWLALKGGRGRGRGGEKPPGHSNAFLVFLPCELKFLKIPAFCH